MFLLVPAHPGCPDQFQRAIKWVCVCVRACMHACVFWFYHKNPFHSETPGFSFGVIFYDLLTFDDIISNLHIIYLVYFRDLGETCPLIANECGFL